MPQVAVADCVIRIERRGAAQVLAGQIMSAALAAEYSQKLPGFGLRRIGLEDFAIEFLGLGQPVGLVQFECPIQVFGCVRHVGWLAVVGQGS